MLSRSPKSSSRLTAEALSKRPRSKSPGSPHAEEEQKHLFTQTLFNRLMFVYFLSRKGWLKFKGDTGLPQSSVERLRSQIQHRELLPHPAQDLVLQRIKQS